MNNGRPPYGNPSQWGQQPAAGQDPAAQFVPGQYPQQSGAGAYQQSGQAQPGYGQQYAQSQPYPQTYQSQPHQAQEGYQQQSWQPYGQQPAQQTWQQGGYPQQGYQQQGYQQPYQAAYPQQGYQQPYGEQPMYQQAMQNGQPLQQGYQQPAQQPQQMGQFFPAKGYSGYVTQPGAQGEGANAISPEVITKVVLFGLLPVLFLLGVLLKSQPLCWIFLAAAAATVAAMWLRELVDSNLRLISTLICSVLAVVALVVAINGPADKQQQDTGSLGGTNAAATGAQSTGMLNWEATPSPTPTATPDPHAEAGAAAERLQSFFYFWHVNNDENMLLLTAPSWRNEQTDPPKALFTIRANRTPADDMHIISISGSEADTMRTAKVTVTISKNITGRDPEILSFNVVMVKENDEWYVDPRSLASNEVVSTTKATNEMPTQPPLHTGNPDTPLYYNPDGGELYHIDQNCGKINSRYLPLQGKFLYSQLNDAPYNELENCTYCGAPLRTQ